MTEQETGQNMGKHLIIFVEVSDHLIDLSNLAIGIGTFTLAIVLAIINWRNNKKDRSVHIADKRQEWSFIFRDHISDLINKQNKLMEFHANPSDVHIISKLGELATLRYKIELMFPKNDKDAIRLMAPIGNIYHELNKVEFNPLIVVQNRDEILKISHEILNSQREKISSLDDNSPLI